jgi:hypothetical protein
MPRFKQHEDDQWFDEIRFETDAGPILRAITRPRYKTSGMSGDEWRVSAAWQIRKGVRGEWVDLDRGFHRLEDACKGLYPIAFSSLAELHEVPITSVDFYRKGEKLKEMTHDGQPLPFLHAVGHLPWAHVIGREDSLVPDNWEAKCFQPGCSEVAISTYRLKKEYGRDGKGSEPYAPTFRRFCLRHLQRGDCGLEDADDNYEVVEGPGPGEASGYEGDVRESAFGGIIGL